MAKVYISSTLSDLEQERRVVIDWLVAAGHQPIHSYRPASESTVESCLGDVDACDVFVLILGHRYGSQPADPRNPENLSMTHLEFRRASAHRSRIRRIALIRTNVPDIRKSDLLDPMRVKLLRGFEEEVRREVRPAEFSDHASLIHGLSTGLQYALPSPGTSSTRQVGSAIAIEQIHDVTEQQDDLCSALEIYERRLPAEERVDSATFIDLIRRHLAGDFGQSWRGHVFVAKDNSRVVGLLICWEDLQANFCFIPYLVTQESRRQRQNPQDISRSLFRELMQVLEKGRKRPWQPRFLFEAASPDLATDSRTRNRDRARLKLFRLICAFAGLHLRCVPIKFVQPKLDPGGTLPGKELLLLYAAADPHNVLSKAEARAMLEWVYLHLYGDDVYDDPDDRRQHALECRQLLQRATQQLPGSVKLGRVQDLFK